MSESQKEAVVASQAEESNASKQARLRRERREAKIKAGGSARLEKITNLSGRPLEPGIYSRAHCCLRLLWSSS